jgi:hypothetical protein
VDFARGGAAVVEHEDAGGDPFGIETAADCVGAQGGDKDPGGIHFFSDGIAGKTNCKPKISEISPKKEGFAVKTIKFWKGAKVNFHLLEFYHKKVGKIVQNSNGWIFYFWGVC